MQLSHRLLRGPANSSTQTRCSCASERPRGTCQTRSRSSPTSHEASLRSSPGSATSSSSRGG
ncbi:hypothetical protein ACFPRL_10985 [Pseudoclavibacter helvolus]